jgi:hypothetical protein
MIKKFRYEKDKMKKLEYYQGKIVTYADIGVNEPGCVALFEESREKVIQDWAFFVDEFHYVLQGTADITYTSHPLHDKEEKLTVKPGDAYFCSKGTRATWKIISSEPFLYLNVIMPRPEATLLGDLL